VSHRIEQIRQLVAKEATKLLAGAETTRGLRPKDLAPRIQAALEKYLLADEPEAGDRAVAAFVNGLQVDDLCLIVACERGDQDAWKDLVENHGATVRSAARAASGNEEAAEDLAQSIWAELHGLRPRADGTPAGKLAYYSGRGSLAGWLRAVVGQLAIDQHRKQARLVQTEDDADFDRLAQHASGAQGSFAVTEAADPEEELARKSSGSQLELALRRAIGELKDEDRLLVKLYYFDDLRLREAGALLGVHEATASRRLARIQGDLRKRVESILLREHQWTKKETEQAFAEAVEDLDADLEPLFAGDGAIVKERSSSG
jgi:RNA polymerase sigma-70 factor, ECF subfamily